MNEIYKSNFPENLGKCFAAEENNAFGFQCIGVDPPGTLVIAKIFVDYNSEITTIDEIKIDKYLRRNTNSKSVKCINYLGRTYLCVHYTEWNEIETILNCLLKQGNYGFWIHPRNDAQFLPGEQFDIRSLELKRIVHIKNMLNEYPYLLIYKLYRYKKHWNWHTIEGKQFCSELREKYNLSAYAKKDNHYLWPTYDDMCKKYKVLHRGTWSAFEPTYTTTSDFLYNTIANAETENE